MGFFLFVFLVHLKVATVLDWRTRCSCCGNICQELFQWADSELEGARRETVGGIGPPPAFFIRDVIARMFVTVIVPLAAVNS